MIDQSWAKGTEGHDVWYKITCKKQNRVLRSQDRPTSGTNEQPGRGRGLRGKKTFWIFQPLARKRINHFPDNQGVKFAPLKFPYFAHSSEGKRLTENAQLRGGQSRQGKLAFIHRPVASRQRPTSNTRLGCFAPRHAEEEMLLILAFWLFQADQWFLVF